MTHGTNMLKWQSKMLSRLRGVRSMPWRREIVRLVSHQDQTAILTKAIKLASLAICIVRWPDNQLHIGNRPPYPSKSLLSSLLRGC
jgi:hypothetical protein